LADYRLYCYDGADKVWVADWIEADSDQEAIATAPVIEAIKSELWLRDRLVATFHDGTATWVKPSSEARALLE
jgi:hypothetical protein